MAEPTGHLVGFFELGSEGADRTATNLGSFLASDDEWTAPIIAEVGPDGAVWVVDWYNYIIQHNPTPIGFQTGKGNAYETALRDKRHGRIYRVSYSSGTPSETYSLSADKLLDCITALGSDNQLWRMHAQRILVEVGKGVPEIEKQLIGLLEDESVDRLGLNVGVQHALWTLHGLGVVATNPEARRIVEKALLHPSGAVRQAAVSVLPRDRNTVQALVEADLLSDPHFQTRLATCLALAESPADPLAARYLYESLKQNPNTEDRWIRDGLISSAAKNVDGFLGELLRENAALPDRASDILTVVARHYASQAPRSIVTRLVKISAGDPKVSKALISGFVEGWPTGIPLEIGEAQFRELASAIETLSAEGRDEFLLLAKKWSVVENFPGPLKASTDRLTARLLDQNSSPEAKSQAARKLVELDDSPRNVRSILSLINLQVSPSLSSSLFRALGASRSDSTPHLILKKWPGLTPGQKREAMATLLGQSAWIESVFDAIESGEVLASDIGSRDWPGLRNHPESKLAERAREISEGAASDSKVSSSILEEYLPAASLAGDAAKGKEIFAGACQVCHLFYGEGAKVGPDLSGIGVRPKEEVLLEILDPNRSVETNYRLWTVTTKSGETISGRLDAETQTSIDLYDLRGERHSFQRSEIVSLSDSGSSIMPSGFEALGKQALADLLEYMAISANH